MGDSRHPWPSPENTASDPLEAEQETPSPAPAIPDEGVSASRRARHMDEGHVRLVDIVGESMRVGKYQDQMMCARNSKRSGDFPRNRNLLTRFVVA